jgi:hypothetical protein
VSLSPHERSLRARIGAYSLHAQHDSRELTANARATFLRKFEEQVDPDGTLAPEERQRRAEHARRAHFARLALQSARVRSRRAARSRATAPTEPDSRDASGVPA